MTAEAGQQIAQGETATILMINVSVHNTIACSAGPNDGQKAGFQPAAFARSATCSADMAFQAAQDRHHLGSSRAMPNVVVESCADDEDSTLHPGKRC